MNVRAVLLIVFDSVRADHCSAYGYDRPTTPTLAALARQGVVFENAHSASSWTKPSVGSIFTGRMPSAHGAFRGVKRTRTSAATTDALPASLPTMAEAFAQAGWRCGAFMSNEQLGSFTRMDRGFDPYLPVLGKADHLIATFEQWLGREPDRPCFAYLHFMETHWPYRPRRRHLTLFGGDRDTNAFRDFSARDYASLRQALRYQSRRMSAEEVADMALMYDGAIRRLDGKLKIVLDLLESSGLIGDTVVAFTADHGEELLDHGSIGHGHTLYDELTHVPLFLHGPGTPQGVRVSASKSQIDLGRTLLDLAGVEAEFPGTSLLAQREVGPVFTELLVGRRYLQTIRDDGWKLIRQLEFAHREADPSRPTMPRQWAEAVAHRASCELYSMSSDPREQYDRACEAGLRDTGQRLARRLDRWWSTCHLPHEEGLPVLAEIGPAVVTRLRDLGYIE